MKLEGKVAIITGGGRGIGKAVARAFAREGAYPCLVARTAAEVEAAAAEIGCALALTGDVSRLEDVERVVAAVMTRAGRVDVLVNNAGVQPPVGPLWENDPDEWLKTVLINLGGVFLCCRSVLPHMIRRGRGKIINLSGGGAASPRPRFSAYAASKAAVVRLTETLAAELADCNVQVNAIAPGAVNTGMLEEVLAAGAAAGEEALSKALEQLKTGGVPAWAAAELAVFLASEESGRLTGRLISAVWDEWRSIPERIDRIMAGELYTLRRVSKGS
ncbi:MAG: SDR family oxidoreductase [Peptococcaceae bacterium]|nr:MAG: SDR family oxidoreductase [Peptococcaceae bacterium]